MSKSFRKLALLVVILTLATYLAACGDNTATPVASTKATVSNAELKVGVQSFVKSLDAQEIESNAGAQVVYNLYDTLIFRDPFSEKFKLKPGLAESWKQLDPTTWEFKLRSNVKFHDGSTLVADDVAYSLNRAIKNEDPRYSNSLAKFFNNFTGVEVVDPATVKISTKRADPLVEMMLSDPNSGITSKAYVQKVGVEKSLTAPISTGPYKVAEFKPNEKLVLERFDDYWGEKAPFKKVTYLTIPEISSRITALANKEVDFIVSVPPDQESTLSGKEGVKLVGTAWPMFHMYVINMSHPVTKNQKLRQAMSLAIDRQALVKTLWKDKGVVPNSLQFANYGEPMYMPDVKTIEYNPEKAAQLVKESGYDGTPVVISNQTNYYTYADLAAQAIMDMWKKVGINAQLNQLDSFPKDISPLMVRTWSNPLHYPDPMGVFATHWTEFSWPATSKFYVPQNPDYKKYYETARYSTNVEERKAAYKQLLLTTAEEGGFFPLYQPYEYFGMRKDISWEIPRNYRPYTLPLRAGEIKIGA